MGAAVNKTSTLPLALVQLLLDGIDLAAEKNPGLGSMRLARVAGSLPNTVGEDSIWKGTEI